MQTCIFCDEHGSFAYAESQGNRLEDQIFKHREKVSKRFNAEKFLVYFQAYTTTFTALRRLEEGIELALQSPSTVGVVIGTRPDCLSSKLMELLRTTSERAFVGVEVGVQSFDDDQLVWMRRGHTGREAIRGIERIAEEAKVDVGIHLMFGWPTETDKQIKETALLCNELPITNVKLHNLHVLTKTPLEDLYRSGEFTPIDIDLYSARVGLFLDHLDPRIAIHRLAALSNRWDELVAPEWVKFKMQSFQGVLDRIQAQGSYQGRLLPQQVERS